MNRKYPFGRLPRKIIILILSAAVILAAGTAAYIKMQQYRAPVRAVQKTLDQIRDLDSEEAQAWISPDQNGGADPLQAEALQKLFEHFDYKILSCARQGKTAEIKVRFENIDTKALARDMKSRMLRESLTASAQDSASEDDAAQNSAPASADTLNLSLMNEMLSLNEYSLVTYEGSIYAVKTDDYWSVSPASGLRSLLTGSLREYLQDPWLLGSGEVLDIYLSLFQSMTAEEWGAYLNTDDIFATYASSAGDIDQLYLSRIAEFYSYEIGRIDENGSEAEISVTVTSIDMEGVLSSYKKRLLNYAGTVESVTDDSGAMADHAAACLMDALTEDAGSANYTLTIHMVNDGTTWQIADTSGLMNALMGNISEAAENF